MENIHVPPAWRHAATAILTRGLRRILVLGAPDRGKSTFCAYLAWRLLRAEWTPALIDADVGQKDIGPPATVTLGYPNLKQALQQLEPAGMYFVGSVSPVAHLLPMVVGTRQLLDRAEAPFVIVNTSGLVTGVGEVLKAYQIDSLRPDVIVALEARHELDPILAAHRHFHQLRLKPSRHARPKSLQLRLERRQAAFRHYFRTTAETAFALDDLILQRLPSRSRNRPETFLSRGRVCGLANDRQELLGLGVIHGFDPAGRRVHLSTPVRRDTVRVLLLGDLRLDL